MTIEHGAPPGRHERASTTARSSYPRPPRRRLLARPAPTQPTLHRYGDRAIARGGGANLSCAATIRREPRPSHRRPQTFPWDRTCSTWHLEFDRDGDEDWRPRASSRRRPTCRTSPPPPLPASTRTRRWPHSCASGRHGRRQKRPQVRRWMRRDKAAGLNLIGFCRDVRRQAWKHLRLAKR